MTTALTPVPERSSTRTGLACLAAAWAWIILYVVGKLERRIIKAADNA